MSQKRVENVQSPSTKAVMAISVALDERLPDVAKVAIEPVEAFDDDYLPFVGVYVGEEEVEQISEKNQNELVEIVDNKVVNQHCCTNEYILRYYFYIEVLVEKCDGAYAEAERIMHMVKQCVLTSYEDIYFDGSGNFRDDESLSSNHYSRSARFYYRYTFP